MQGWGFYNKIAISDWTNDPARAAYGVTPFVAPFRLPPLLFSFL
jgi:hypothetical protein